jgi:hypothetical protein
MLLEITELHSRVLPLISPVAYDLLPLIRYHARLSTKREFSSGQPSTTTHGGQIFSVPLFIGWKPLFLRATAVLPCGRGKVNFPDF